METVGIGVQPDGKLVVSGTAGFPSSGHSSKAALARFNPDGTLDRTFGDGGQFEAATSGAEAVALAIQPDGRILTLVNEFRGFQVSRYLTDGSLDPSFGIDGTFEFRGVRARHPTGLSLAPGGKIVIAGDNFRRPYVARLLPDGTPDPSLTGDGFKPFDLPGREEWAGDVAVDRQSRIVLGAEVANRSSVIRLRPDGALDQSFSGDGLAQLEGGAIFTPPIALEPDGSILALGAEDESRFLARIDPSGSPDDSFGANGTTQVPPLVVPEDLALDPAGGILVAGADPDPSDPTRGAAAVARFDRLGKLDDAFADDGVATVDSGGCCTVATDAEGRVLLPAGNPAFGLARLTSDGSQDPTLSGTGRAEAALPPRRLRAETELSALTALPHGGLVAAAYSLQQDEGDELPLALHRYGRDGEIEPSFGGYDAIPERFNQYAAAALAQPDGKLVVPVGAFGTARVGAVRFNADGSLDRSFSGDGVADVRVGGEVTLRFPVRDAALQPDGKILILTYRFGEGRVVRLNPDGSLDRSFAGNGVARVDYRGASSSPESIAIAPDGAIVLCGTITTIDSIDVGVFRLTADGARDRSFDGDGRKWLHIFGIEDGVQAVVQPDGRIVLAADNAGSIAEKRPGRDFLARLTHRGRLDRSFSDDGIARPAFGYHERGYLSSLALDQRGRVVVFGATYGSFVLARYLRGGRLDRTFGRGGIALQRLGRRAQTPNPARALVIQPDGRIVAGGTTVNGNIELIRRLP